MCVCVHVLCRQQAKAITSPPIDTTGRGRKGGKGHFIHLCRNLSGGGGGGEGGKGGGGKGRRRKRRSRGREVEEKEEEEEKRRRSREKKEEEEEEGGEKLHFRSSTFI